MVPAAALALVVTASAARPTPEPSAATVRIDVVATDQRGRAIDTLKPGDFELREEGALQRIESVRVVNVGGAAPGGPAPAPITSSVDERAEAARPDTRIFALFLDDYHVTAGENSRRVRDAVRRFINEDLGPRDLVVVMRPLDSLLAIRLTRDRQALVRLIDSFEGRNGDYAPRNTYEQEYIAGTPGRIDAVRAQVTVSALNALALHIGRLSDARKTLILVSEGLPPPERRRGFEPLPTINTVVRSANRSNVSIYAVDPADRAAGGPLPREAGLLRTLSADTSGQTIEAADVDAGFRRLVSDSSTYYVLSYTSPQGDDGKLHEVQVSVKRAGVRLRARKGYYAPTPDELMRARLLALGTTPLRPPPPLEPPRHISPLITPWFGVSRGAEGKTRVTFVWEPVARVPGDRTPRQPSRLVLEARAADGSTAYEGPVLAAGPARVEAADDGRARAVFEVPPGRLRLRMSIEDAAAQVLDTDIRDLAVRDLNASIVLGSPEILRARTARDFRALEADPDAVPVAARAFSRAERLLIRFTAYSADDAGPAVSARLMTRMSQPIRELVVQPARSAGRHHIDLPLAGFAVGEYLIELTARSAAGEVRELLTFRVTN